MPSLDDPDVGLPAFLADPAMLPDGEPVGMDRAGEHLKYLVGNPRLSEADTHASSPLLPEGDPLGARTSGRASHVHYMTWRWFSQTEITLTDPDGVRTLPRR